MRPYRLSLALAFATVLGFACVANAQDLFIGRTSCPGCDDGNDDAFATTRTDISLVGASASGTIETAFFPWSATDCPAAAKIKVFRRHGNSLIFVAERGPFDVTSPQMTVSLAPPIAVEQGDLIGIARVADCGGPQVFTLRPFVGPPAYAAYAGDITTDVSLSNGRMSAATLNLLARGTATEIIAFVLPAAGSTPGNFGSFFRTGVQLSNVDSTLARTGRFVFHPAGVPGSPSDPSLTFSVAPLETVSYDDLVQSMGQSGLGTLDVVIDLPSEIFPLVVARIYDDHGSLGTSGFSERAIRPVNAYQIDNPVLFNLSTGFLVTPPDSTRFRFNIGVRSLLGGATVTFRVRDASGTSVRSVTKTYDPTFFEQQSVEDLLGGPIATNEVIEVSVSGVLGSSVIVYGATVDNTTNDASLQIVTVATVGVR